MSFNFDYPYVSSYLQWESAISGLDTPPLTPLYTTPVYYPTLPLLPNPLSHYSSPPSTPVQTPDYLPPVPLQLNSSASPPTSSSCYSYTQHCNNGTPAYFTDIYNPAQLPYTPVLETVSRTAPQRFSPYQRSRRVSPKLKTVSQQVPPYPLTPTVTTPPSTPSLLEQTAYTIPSLSEQAALTIPSLLEEAASTIPSLSEQAALTTPSLSEQAPSTIPSLLEQAASSITKIKPLYSTPEPVLKPLVRKRKTRTEMTDHQKTQLELVFSIYKYLGHDIRTKVAEEVGLPEKTVLYWFQNRRAREKKAQKNSPQ